MLQVTGYRLQVTGYKLQVAGSRLHIKGFRVKVEVYRLKCKFVISRPVRQDLLGLASHHIVDNFMRRPYGFLL